MFQDFILEHNSQPPAFLHSELNSTSIHCSRNDHLLLPSYLLLSVLCFSLFTVNLSDRLFFLHFNFDRCRLTYKDQLINIYSFPPSLLFYSCFKSWLAQLQFLHNLFRLFSLWDLWKISLIHVLPTPLVSTRRRRWHYLLNILLSRRLSGHSPSNHGQYHQVSSNLSYHPNCMILSTRLPSASL